MDRFARWVAFVPAAIGSGFVVLVLTNNLTDWLSGDWPAIARLWPLQYTLADLGWPLIFVLAGASVAPSHRLPAAVFLACVAVVFALAIGGSLSLNWLTDVPMLFYKVGLGLTVAGAVLGIAAVMRLNPKGTSARR